MFDYIFRGQGSAEEAAKAGNIDDANKVSDEFVLLLLLFFF